MLIINSFIKYIGNILSPKDIRIIKLTKLDVILFGTSKLADVTTEIPFSCVNTGRIRSHEPISNYNTNRILINFDRRKLQPVTPLIISRFTCLLSSKALLPSFQRSLRENKTLLSYFLLCERLEQHSKNIRTPCR